MHVFTVTPRFKLKVEVEDSTGLAVFVLFEKECGSLFKKSCAEVFVEFMRDPEHVRDNVHPPLFNELCEKKLLFKIETKAISPKRYNGTFCVKRVCDDSTIVEMFSLHGSENTPSKAIFTPQTTSDVGLEDICPDIDCTHAARKMVRRTGVSFIDGCDAEIVPDTQVVSFQTYSGTVTPTKRKLETEFNEAAPGSSGANENEASTMETFKVEE